MQIPIHSEPPSPVRCLGCDVCRIETWLGKDKIVCSLCGAFWQSFSPPWPAEVISFNARRLLEKLDHSDSHGRHQPLQQRLREILGLPEIAAAQRTH
jgi:hypothetical protein